MDIFISDILFFSEKQQQPSGKGKSSNANHTQNAIQAQNGANKSEPTWVHEIFQGTLTNETRCLNCETVSLFDYSRNLTSEKKVQY